MLSIKVQIVDPMTVLTERHMNSTNFCSGFVPLTSVAKSTPRPLRKALGEETETILVLWHRDETPVDAKKGDQRVGTGVSPE